MIALENINKVVLMKILIAQGLVTFLSILISHYVAGPIFRVEKSLNVLKTGDLTHRIYLRKFDQFTGLAAMFNETMETLHNTIKQDRAKLDGAIKKIESAGGEKKFADAIDDLKQVNKSFTI
jgi:methyl-accepting chemotaxis protein